MKNHFSRTKLFKNLKDYRCIGQNVKVPYDPIPRDNHCF